MKRQWTIKTATLHVSGRIWQGHDICHDYDITGKPEPRTMAEAKQIAGDFAELYSAQVSHTRQTVQQTVTTRQIAA